MHTNAHIWRMTLSLLPRVLMLRYDNYMHCAHVRAHDYSDVEMKLTPLSSTKFGSGRPSEQAHALGDFIKTSIIA